MCNLYLKYTNTIIQFAFTLQRNCGRGRSTREVNDTTTWSGEVQEGGGVLAQSGSRPCSPQQERVPLELEFVVGSKDVISTDTLVRADHRSNNLRES